MIKGKRLGKKIDSESSESSSHWRHVIDCILEHNFTVQVLQHLHGSGAVSLSGERLAIQGPQFTGP